MKTYKSIVALSLAVSACHTVTVVNDKGPELSTDVRSEEQWHHTGIFGLVTYSGEHAMRDMCRSDEQWTSVTTQQGPAAVGVEAGLYALGYVPSLWLAAPIANFVWDPLTLKWTCAAKPAAKG